MKNLSAKELREIEALYRSGTQSMASIAKRFGITRQSLAERVKRHGWRAGAATRPDQPGKQPGKRGIDSEPDLSAAADRAATVEVEVILSHRRGVQKLRNLVGALEDELAAFLATGPQIEPADDEAKANRVMLVRLATLAQTVEALSRARYRLVVAERLIFDIPNKPPQPGEAAAEMMQRWDAHVEAEAAKRPYLLGKPPPKRSADEGGGGSTDGGGGRSAP